MNELLKYADNLVVLKIQNNTLFRELKKSIKIHIIKVIELISCF